MGAGLHVDTTAQFLLRLLGGVRIIVTSMSVRLFVCLSVTLSARITRKNTWLNFTSFLFMQFPTAVVRRCDVSCTSGWLEHAIFSHSSPAARRVSLCKRRHNTTSINNSRDFHQILLNVKDRRVLVVSCAARGRSLLSTDVSCTIRPMYLSLRGSC